MYTTLLLLLLLFECTPVRSSFPTQKCIHTVYTANRMGRQSKAHKGPKLRQTLFFSEATQPKGHPECSVISVHLGTDQ